MKTITLNDLGFTSNLKKHQEKNSLESFSVGRVILEHKDRYIVKTATNELESELIGNLRFNAINRSDLPAVGDWVAIAQYDENKALIHAVYPRKTLLERKAVGKLNETQIIATNIDFGIIVQSVNRDFSINRLERYITICNTSNITPIIVLNKIDLINKNELSILLNTIKNRIKNVEVYPISNHTLVGLEKLKSIFLKGKTYCLLGSSGVGKSTLINTLTETNLMETGEISESIDRGKHVTSHRELIVFNNGILVDNPGMREVGMTDNADGIELTFEQILEISTDCKFSDCNHINEKGCAILKALENGDINEETFANFQKIERERMHYESSLTEKKQQGKNLAKLIRQNKKSRNNNKY